jgi:pimeloyl-ACP methyl ester carboxylesterase
MFAILLAAAFVRAEPDPTDAATELWQVSPDGGGKPWAAPAARPEKSRAVVLIPGLFIHAVRPVKATLPDRRPWEDPKSELVKALAPDFDVFAFGYAQTVAVDAVAQSAGLKDAVARLRKAGYAELVLVGHSAGGVVARQFVEANPDAGVAKVIAVAAPFAGVEIANAKLGVPKVQEPFVRSLAPEARAAAAGKNPPGGGVPLACVVCKLRLVETDGLVPTRSQWPDDLQRAGVPVVRSSASHFRVMSSPAAAKTIAALARDKLTLWTPDETEAARKAIFGEPKK